MGDEQELDDGILMIAIDHPPVNAIATPVRFAIASALRRANDDPRIRAVVLTGHGRLFSAGADLGEFAAGTAMDPPSLHADILPLMASMTKPVVAAVGGMALGGGLELALGCHDRVFASGTRVGLPETTLGLMPGAGGTQLLPRAIGIARAAELIVSGRVVPIEDIAVPALAHAIVTADRLIETARHRASQLAESPARFRAIVDRTIDDPAADAHLTQLALDCAARNDHLPGIAHALEAVALTRSTNIADGMRAEFALFEPLLASVESRALRHLFIAERRRKMTPEVAQSERRFVERVEARLALEASALVEDGVDRTAIDRIHERWAFWRLSARPAPADDADVEARLLAAIIDEGRKVLETSGDETEADLDLALVRDGRFARVHGGPFFLASIIGIDGPRTSDRSDDGN